MDFLDDPAEMSPEQRLAEVAAILAVGYLRMRESRVLPAPCAPERPPFTEKPLDSRRRPRPLCVEGSVAGEPTPAEVQA